QREGLLVSSEAGEEPPASLQRRPVLGIELVRVLVAGGGALRVAELLVEDAPHGVMDLRSRRRRPQRPRLRGEVRELLASSLNLGVGRFSLGDLRRKFLRHDRVHARRKRSRASRVESLLAPPQGGRSGDTLRNSPCQLTAAGFWHGQLRRVSPDLGGGPGAVLDLAEQLADGGNVAMQL